MVKLLLLRVATYRQFPLPVRFNDYENREVLENGGGWTKNVYRTPIANRGRSIEWSSYFYYASPPSGGFRFRSYKNRGLLENGGSVDEKNPKPYGQHAIANVIYFLAYRMRPQFPTKKIQLAVRRHLLLI
jgi:hypothetical protein